MTAKHPDDSVMKPGVASTRQCDRWQFAPEHGAQGLWDWDTRSNRVFYSDNLKHILGIGDAASSFAYEDWVDRLQPDDAAATLEALQRFVADAAPTYENEHRLRCDDGAYKWIRARGRALALAADERPLRVVGTCVDIDAAKAVEAALHEREERLRHVAARIPGAVYEFVLRPDGTTGIRYASPGTQKLFRVSLEAAKDDAFVLFKYVDPEVFDQVLASMRESARTFSPWSQELPMLFPDRERRWLHAESVPEPQPDGSILWQGFISDVTEQKRVDLALRESSERLRRITSRLPGVVFEFRLRPDGGTALPFASDAFRELFGLDPAEVNEGAARAFTRFHQDDLPKLEAAIARSARTLEPLKDDYRLLEPANGERWVHIDAVPIREADGSVLWHGVVADITPAKRAEASVRREKAFVEALVQNLATPTLVLSADGTVRVWNRALENLTGVRAAEVVGTREHGRHARGRRADDLRPDRPAAAAG